MNEFLDPDILAEFLDEASTCIQILSDSLLSVESGEISDTLVNEMFRAAHSLKGLAGMLDFREIAKVTHSAETVLDLVRDGKLSFSQDVVEVLFMAIDVLMGKVANIQHNKATDDEGDATAVIERMEAQIESVRTASSSNPVEQLGELPACVQERFDIEDVIQCGCAKNTGSRVYVLQISLAEAFTRGINVVTVFHGLEERLSVQQVWALYEDAISIWRPLENFGYDVAVLCFTNKEISEALSGIGLNAIKVWEICTGQALTAPLIVNAADTAEDHFSGMSSQLREEMRQHVESWVASTQEELDSITNQTLLWEQDPLKGDCLKEIYRLLHSIKSSATTMGFAATGALTHAVESLLSIFRDSELPLDESLAQIIYDYSDHVSSVLASLKQGTEVPLPSGSLSKRIDTALQGAALAADSKVEWYDLDISEKCVVADALSAGRRILRCAIQMEKDTELADIRCLMLARELQQAGAVLVLSPSIDELEQGLEQVDVLFVWLATDWSVGRTEELLTMDMVARCVVEEIVHFDGVTRPESTIGAGSDTRRVEDGEGVVKPTAALNSRAGQSIQTDTVRVDTARIDEIMNAAGELVITKARLIQLIEVVTGQFRALDATALEQAVSFATEHGTSGSSNNGNHSRLSLDRLRTLGKWVQEVKEVQEAANNLRDVALTLHRYSGTIQNGVMQMRMVPIGPLFQRFNRLVRDVSKAKDKRARLVTIGDATELDKKLIDELVDPLTHLIRNAVDHGLENPSEREASGKPAEGSVTLHAYHEGGQICVQVRDDGKGVNISRVKEKALSRGLADAASLERMSDGEIAEFIFHPGFSTAEQVTNISGRGVGMDIVKSKINELKGKVEVESVAGEGTIFTIRLPLTLAMIRALLVQIGNGRYAIPVESVREIVEAEKTSIKSIKGRGQAIFIRNDIVSLVNLSEAIQVESLKGASSEALRAVVTRNTKETFAIPVDFVIGEEEIVVKALSDEFASVRGVSGATILGDGKLALILDVEAVAEGYKKNINCIGASEHEQLHA